MKKWLYEHLWKTAPDHLFWIVGAALILIVSGATPEEWLQKAANQIHRDVIPMLSINTLSLILRLFPIVLGLMLFGWAVVLLRRDRPTVATSATPIPPTERPPLPAQASVVGQSALLKRYGGNDLARLDEALYSMFDYITKISGPAQRDAEYNLVHNWEVKMLSPEQGPLYFILEIERIRGELLRCHKALHNMIYNEYNYYMEELRDASFEGRSTELFTCLDDFKQVISALQPNASLDHSKLRLLIGDKHAKFAKGVADYAFWIRDARERIRQKRDEISSLQGAP